MPHLVGVQDSVHELVHDDPIHSDGEISQFPSSDEDSDLDECDYSGTQDDDYSDDDIDEDNPIVPLYSRSDSIQQHLDRFVGEDPLEPHRRTDDEDSLPSLWSVSESSDDGNDDGERRAPYPISAFPDPSNPITPPRSFRFVREFVSSLVTAEMLHRAGVDSDPTRALILMQGLEPVSGDLMARYHKLRGGDDLDGSATCAICRENLSSQDPDLQEDEAANANVAHSTELPFHSPYHGVLAFPCIHLFHWHCLSPWLSCKTTCPTCRFDIDPLSLTLKTNDQRAREKWRAPERQSLSAWIEEEEAFQAGRYEHPVPSIQPAVMYENNTLPVFPEGATMFSGSEIGGARAIAFTMDIPSSSPALQDPDINTVTGGREDMDDSDDDNMDSTDFYTATSSSSMSGLETMELGSLHPNAPQTHTNFMYLNLNVDPTLGPHDEQRAVLRSALQSFGRI